MLGRLLDEPATTRLVSIPATYRSGLNRVEVRRGRYIEPGARNEVLVSEAFATANQLQPGDTFHADYGPLGSIAFRFV